MSTEEFKKPTLEQNIEQFLSDDGENNNEYLDEVDSDHEEYIQNCFQDDIVEIIFNNIVSYIDNQAIPLCEFLTRDDVEDIITTLSTS